MATNHARILLGCYRTGEVSDPQVFTAAIIAILAKFPEPVQRAVCNPTAGLPAQSKWLPTTSEILTACKDEERRQDTVARYAAMRMAAPFEGLKTLPRVASGDGGPGTVYTATGFHEAVEKHGRPFGVFESGRERPYRG